MSKFWKKLSITTKFTSGFGLLLLLLVMIAITGYLALGYVHDAESTIQKSNKIHDMVLEMEGAMEKARRLHGDFFLYYPLIGFTKAHDLYARQSAQQITNIVLNSNRLKEMLSDSNVSAALQKNRVDLNLYLSSAKRFADTSAESIELIRELAAPVNGLESLFENTTTALQIETAEHPHLNELFEKMISFSKDYLIKRQRHSMQSSFNILERLRKAIDNDSSFSADQRRNAHLLLARWQETAEKILIVDVNIKSKFNDFSLQAVATDPAAAALIRLAKEDVENAQLRISRAHRSTVVIMAAIALIGLAVKDELKRIEPIGTNSTS